MGVSSMRVGKSYISLFVLKEMLAQLIILFLIEYILPIASFENGC